MTDKINDKISVYLIKITFMSVVDDTFTIAFSIILLKIKSNDDIVVVPSVSVIIIWSYVTIVRRRISLDFVDSICISSYIYDNYIWTTTLKDWVVKRNSRFVEKMKTCRGSIGVHDSKSCIDIRII